METDAIDAALADLTREQDRQRRDFDRLRREYDQLAIKLRSPGTKFLVDLEYKLVFPTDTADGVITVGAASLHVTTPIETLPGALHAVYVLSAYAPSSNTPVLISDGSVIVSPADAISVGLHRQRQTSPTRIETSVVLYNSGASPQDVAVRVWRRLGMGS